MKLESERLKEFQAFYGKLQQIQFQEMFYIPEEGNSQYSEGFRKLVKRAIDRVKKQQYLSIQNPQQHKKVSLTVVYDENFIKKKKDLWPVHKKANNIKESVNQSAYRPSPIKITLPKLQTPKSRLNIRGEELSSKFIRSSDKQIRKMFDEMKTEIPLNQSNKNLHLSPKRKMIKPRKMKSECVDEMPSNKSIIEGEQITPWALNSTSTQYFS